MKKNRSICFPPGDVHRGQAALSTEDGKAQHWVERSQLPRSVVLQQVLEGQKPAERKAFKERMTEAVHDLLTSISDPGHYGFAGPSAQDWRFLLSLSPRNKDALFLEKLDAFANAFPEEFQAIMRGLVPECGGWGGDQIISVSSVPESSVPNGTTRDYHRAPTCTPSGAPRPLDEEGREIGEPSLYRIPGQSQQDQSMLRLLFKVGGPQHGTIFVRGLQRYCPDLAVPEDLLPLADPAAASLAYMGGHCSRLLRARLGAELGRANSFSAACVKRANAIQQ